MAERLTFTKDRRTEEGALHKLLVTLIEMYEAQHYQMDESQPYEILQHIMELSGTRQANLVGIIGSIGVVSFAISFRQMRSRSYCYQKSAIAVF